MGTYGSGGESYMLEACCHHSIHNFTVFLTLIQYFQSPMADSIEKQPLQPAISGFAPQAVPTTPRGDHDYRTSNKVKRSTI